MLYNAKEYDLLTCKRDIFRYARLEDENEVVRAGRNKLGWLPTEMTPISSRRLCFLKEN
jgi:hypothetical protein